ncbi:hypothetical protein M9H77_08644 [Catharanthus roseus]|uniref:Uncharacterized protein n=1 Tax=Catharanthus roseus TaxID=4058 RepID=A0ACC0BYJ9_CATRO|nr:hypothetical protein M9H77_08644 [Catharanthus roseus]
MASNSFISNNLSEDIARKSVKALLKWRKLHPRNPQDGNRKPPRLHEEDEEEEEEEEEEVENDTNDHGFLYLVLTLKKIPPKDLSRTPHTIPLPHPLHSFLNDSLNLCLIIDDRSIKSPYRITSEAVQKRIKSEGIPITRVLKLSKLKSEYNSFEARRNLYNLFDMFLADKRIFPLLPKLLGKQFYKKKRKVPVPLDMRQSTNWKEQIERALNSALLCFGNGTCSALKVGRCGSNSLMGCDEIVENVFAAIGGIQEVVPKRWKGIRALHLKLSDSLALPIFDDGPDSRLIIDNNRVQEGGLQSGKLQKLEDKEIKKDKIFYNAESMGQKRKKEEALNKRSANKE